MTFKWIKLTIVLASCVLFFIIILEIYTFQRKFIITSNPAGTGILDTLLLPEQRNRDQNLANSSLTSKFNNTEAKHCPANFSISNAGLHKYKIVIYPSIHCSNNESTTKPVSFIVFIHSHVAKKERRDTIRKTWGSVASDYCGKVIFVTGIKLHLVEAIKEESLQHGDILQMDFPDDAQNDVLKSVYSLLYFSQIYCDDGCVTLRYLVKTDDDMVINLKKLGDIMNRFQSRADVMAGTLEPRRIDVIKSNMDAKHLVIKNTGDKEEFSKYLRRELYLLSFDVVLKFHKLLPFIALPNNYYENVLVTNVLAHQAKLSMMSLGNLLPAKRQLTEKTACDFVRGKVVAVRGFILFQKANKLWKSLRSGDRC